MLNIKGQTRTFWIAVLALSFGMQPVTTDIYLSTLPALAQAFNVTQRAIDTTLQTYLISYAVVQLFIGPLVDRFGRRPMLLGAIAIYIVASLIGAMSPNLATLNISRALQAVGVCGAIISARAMVRDLLEPQEGAALLARSMSFMGVLALACPPLGGALQSLLGWPSTFFAMALFGVGLALFVGLRLPETSAVRQKNTLNVKILLSNYWAIARNPEFLVFSLIAAGAYSALMVFFVKSPVVFIQQFGLSPLQFGLCLSLCTCGFIVGTLIGRKMVGRIGVNAGVRWGSLFALAGALVMLGLTGYGAMSIYTYLGCQLIYMIGHGILQPLTQAAAIGPFPEKAGAASAVLGFVIHAGAALWILLLGPLAPQWGWPLGMMGATLLIAACALRLEIKKPLASKNV